MKRALSRVVTGGGALLVLACHGRDATVTVRATGGPDDAPRGGLEITAYPFDPQRILDSLAAGAPTPAPEFPELEQAMRDYRPPEDGRFDRVGAPWRALRDTVVALADTLRTLDRRSPAYATRYESFRVVYGRLAQRAAERDAALRALNGPQLDLARSVQAAAESLRAWEYEAYAGYAEAAAARLAATERTVRTATTDPSGVARLDLEPGPWWLIAREPDAENPFLERHWHLPIRVTRLVPLRVPLGDRTVVVRWRR